MATDSEAGGLSFHPMDQFIVSRLFCSDNAETAINECTTNIAWYEITNMTVWLALSVLAVFALLVLGTRKRGVVPSRTQSVAELAYGFIHKMVEDVCGREGLKYFPYIMTLFMFIVMANFLALIPMSFSPTSQFAVTGVLAIAVFVTVIVLGFVKNGVGFLGLFWLTAAPLVMRPILAVIEFILFWMRPVSHAVRLGGAILAGHALLKVFAGFAQITPAAPLAIFGVVSIYALEVLVAAIQAYVFTILTCVYLKDALHPHH
ncbi:F0F1 ATP synthase subunit A [Aestuariibius sp. 2305UL40-4]|uniref:F0F1 ATP synthase subunit A n=1 Tax=Aestuariibius violaceus TaxID=3234132 RepID=UPI00345E9899